MINIEAVLTILFIHWFADFVCQTDWQAKNKSSSNAALVSHTLNYTGIFGLCTVVAMLVGGVEYGLKPILMFLLTTFVVHTIADYFTSRLNSHLWKQQKVHYFFVSVGFDQFLHFVQLLLTYYYLTTP